ncbi:hypothetical protein [Hymenobacter sp. BT730]|uniref:hypothetical protein n=1 Tax=Hymenobacter sp. BT730 TaxID=3063332 RepID=UPI0026DFA900|nr:hypothetical protein [Hymenobacter sp. BT730]
MRTILTPRTCFIVLTLLGLVFWANSLTLPAFTSVDARDNLDQQYLLEHSLTTEQYWQAVAKVETRKYVYEDIGTGLAALGAALLLFTVYKKVWQWRDFLTVKSPAKRQLFWVLNLALLLSCLNAYWDYSSGGVRRIYDPKADAFGLAMFQEMVGSIFIYAFLNAMLWLIARRAGPSTNLFKRRPNYGLGSKFLEVVYAVLILFLLYNISISLRYGTPYGVLENVLILYVVLSVRAITMLPASVSRQAA